LSVYMYVYMIVCVQLMYTDNTQLYINWCTQTNDMVLCICTWNSQLYIYHIELYVTCQMFRYRGCGHQSMNVPTSRWGGSQKCLCTLTNYTEIFVCVDKLHRNVCTYNRVCRHQSLNLYMYKHFGNLVAGRFYEKPKFVAGSAMICVMCIQICHMCYVYSNIHIQYVFTCGKSWSVADNAMLCGMCIQIYHLWYMLYAFKCIACVTCSKTNKTSTGWLRLVGSTKL